MNRASKNEIAVQNSRTMCNYLVSQRHMTLTEISNLIEYSRDFICKLRGKNPPSKVELALFLGLAETAEIPPTLALKKGLTVEDIIHWNTQGQ